MDRMNSATAMIDFHIAARFVLLFFALFFPFCSCAFVWFLSAFRCFVLGLRV